MIDLSPNYLETVKGILAEHVRECEVRAFGSRVTWTAKDYSDLDLAMVGVSALDWGTLGQLKEAFEQSDLPMRVDVLDWHTITDSFRKVIEQDYVVVQKGEDGKSAVEEEEQRMAGEWREITLGDCITINKSTYSPKDAWQFINYLDTGNITENRISEFQYLIVGRDEIPSRARRKVRPGDIVYSTVRPNQRHFGLLREVPENFLVSTGFSIISGKSGFSDTDFIYWFLTQDHVVELLHTIAEHSTSAYPSIRPADIKQLSLNLPPFPEQRSIAHILGTLDDKIELNRRMNETLEAMARALFKDWFVDFGPVRAKMKGRDTGLPKHLDNLFPNRLVPSELGEIPEGWEIATLNRIAENPRRGIQAQQITPGTPYIALEHIPKRCIALSEWSIADGVASNKFKFVQGDILFGKLRPYFHKVIIAPMDGVCSTDIVVISPTTADWYGFVICHVSSSTFVDYTNAGSIGTKMPRTKWSDMARYEITLPNQTLARTFTKQVKPLFKRIVAAIHESHTLVAMRDTLIPKLISGEMRMKNAETFFDRIP